MLFRSNKGSRQEMKNRRGIFLTSVISKLFERVILRKIEDQMECSQYQSGARKERGTADNWIVIMAVIDNNRRLKKIRI